MTRYISPEKKRRKRARRLRRRLIRLMMAVVILGVGYLIYNPNVVADPTARARVEVIRGKVGGLAVMGKEWGVVLTNQAVKAVDTALKTTKVPKKMDGEIKEVVVEDVVADFTKQLKELPVEKAREVTQQFCERVAGESSE
ncbi:hypothetical protein A3A66_00160 [Microgenomates group bacterium RIFCSPLOWO2_01_FULL_46_13]|nr:MAG: hypothetical protein A2783_03440 [Microgenomates group bacterium RIFCSPHIGHO2_01_FULL_45_11]OGV94433.1 MAG: hypothetical protein A3A66_00160 [Microgenomates group bacterium RIFCSPLOWO2_01_FULL_46_13]